MPKLLGPHCLQPLDGGYRGNAPPAFVKPDPGASELLAGSRYIGVPI